LEISGVRMITAQQARDLASKSVRAKLSTELRPVLSKIRAAALEGKYSVIIDEEDCAVTFKLLRTATPLLEEELGFSVTFKGNNYEQWATIKWKEGS